MSTIVIVDDEVMITKTLAMLIELKLKSEVITFNTPNEALRFISSNSKKIDVVVSDFLMPEINGIEFLLKVKHINDEIESILLTGYADKENAIKSINDVGVYYYLEKPWNNDELIKIVSNAVEKKQLKEQLHEKITDLEKSNEEITRLYDLMKNEYNHQIEGSRSLMVTLANTIEARDKYTEGHTRRVSLIAKSIGKKLGLSKEDINTLEIVGIIHDIGKVGISDSILNKAGKLTVDEFSHIKSHPVIGERICRSLNILETSLKPILHHHEKLDGSGYPNGLRGDEIDIVTRIITVADMFDALYSERPYRTKLEYETVKEILSNDVQKGQIDSTIVDVLFDLIESEALVI